MKIVCDACQAKYSISDDKVQGKVFKIRCKKCSNIIVVRGGAGAAEQAAAPAPEKDTRVYDYGYEGGDQAPAGDEAVWHVVINQDQVGPMTAAEVQQRFAAGEIDGETYTWREGFADWLPLVAGRCVRGVRRLGQHDRGGRRWWRCGGGRRDVRRRLVTRPARCAAIRAICSRPPRRARRRAAGDDDGDLFGSKPSAASSASAQAAAQRQAPRRAQRELGAVLAQQPRAARERQARPERLGVGRRRRAVTRPAPPVARARA